jgi:hypothetical protein
MTAVDIVLIVAVAALAAALVLTLRAHRRDTLRIESREAAAADQSQRVTEASANSERSQAEKHRAQAAREHAEAELHEARLQIVALEQRRNALEADVAEEAGRRGLFRRSSSEIPPEGAERERTGASRGDA